MSMFVIMETLPPENRPTAAPAAELSAPVEPAVSGYSTAKTALDFVLALTLLIVTAPLTGLAMLLVKWTSPGPAIYTQTRIGRQGRPFTIFKLRSMTHNCESLTGAQWSRPGDCRVTAVGRWLRRTHIDELPQLWNVLRGDMSLIGPRPERPEFLPELEHAIPCYRQRLLARPGVTGFAQVQLPPDTDFDSVRIKLAYDLYYLRHVSFLFDVRIYFGTFCKILGMSQGTIGTLGYFPRREVVAAEYQMVSALPATPDQQ